MSTAPDFLRVVIDEPDVCPYLPEQTARLPLSLPARRVTPEQVDQLLASGYRRSGSFFYRTRCPNCSACVPLRVRPVDFRASRSQRRVWKRGLRELECRLGPAQVSPERVNLFNVHRSQRNLDHGNPPADQADYESFLLSAPLEVVELSFWYGDRLIAVSITDIGATSLSAVYCFFDPAASRFSPGTYAILTQIELGRRWQKKWVYLGFYVAQNRHLNYKARYLPHERRVHGVWKVFPEGCDSGSFALPPVVDI